jgi:hypothetical protein
MNPSNEWWSNPAEPEAVELCACPECGLPAEVVEGSRCAGGELVGVRCVGRHWFFGLRDRLVA